MPNIPSNGEIRLQTLKNAYGGSNPISLKDYYRSPNGLTTGAKLSTLVMEPDTFVNGIWLPYGSANAQGRWSNGWLVEITTLYWLGSNEVYSGPYTAATSITTGGWTYIRGPLEADGTYSNGYAIRREKITTNPPLWEPSETGWMPFGNNNSTASWFVDLAGNTNVTWKGSRVVNGKPGDLSEITQDGWTYYKGPFHSSQQFGVNYQLRRVQKTEEEPINTGIPTSGAISLGQFRGAYYD